MGLRDLWQHRLGEEEVNHQPGRIDESRVNGLENPAGSTFTDLATNGMISPMLAVGCVKFFGQFVRGFLPG